MENTKKETDLNEIINIAKNISRRRAEGTLDDSILDEAWDRYRQLRESFPSKR